MSTPAITLIPFSPEGSWDGLQEQLTDLGYVTNWAAKQECTQTHTPMDQAVAVCLFDRVSLTDRRSATIHGMARWGALPRMGLFLGDQREWDADFVFRCNDFSNWPCSPHELDMRLRRLCATADGDRARHGQRLVDLIHLNLIGDSESFVAAIDRLKRFALCDAPVLVEGETGTGKELAARAIHYFSARRDHPFIPVNCGALPDTLLENELFGHAQGAFTDARKNQTGLIAQAELGSLFLDELESLTPRAQVSLLRFLQEMEYRPLGAERNVRADVRVIAATNVPINNLVADLGFRQDLLYRLDVMPVRLPPLRQRGRDALLLAEHFLADLRRRYGQPDKFLHEDSIAWMQAHDWPGNIRELENMLHREFLLSDGPAIRFGASPEQAGIGPFAAAKARAIEAFEREYLVRILAQARGNVTEAAKHAGKERRAFGKLLKKHGIEKRMFAC